MMKSKADLIMHPVRMKIIQHLAKGPATVSELLEWLEGVPQATLYRHLNALKKGDILTITQERQVRGATEKTYALMEKGSRVTPEEGAAMSKDEHVKLFMTFFANLLTQTEDFFSGEVDLTKDIYGFGQVDLYLTDEEWEKLREDLYGLIKGYAEKKKEPGVRKVTMAQFFVPEPSEKKEDE
ncbi:helix-turn-helix domain-containing protein [Jeotgalibacillus sp. R-1-5s-1]|uniref:helix-turn-helix domain-containing protein n=1 Tax=Jeotgalibacillus sp. R-1-5s-1 TaxID=2555897 RepID=UPI00141B7292|nr:helix-turn-helix domain-containing protein [Jeotgalibacillus sp. R-1-5s-1]